MLLPITLPTARPGDPTSAAFTLTTISGSEVPKPTIVNPTIKGDTQPLCQGDRPPNDRLAAEKQKRKPSNDKKIGHSAGKMSKSRHGQKTERTCLVTCALAARQRLGGSEGFEDLLYIRLNPYNSTYRGYPKING